MIDIWGIENLNAASMIETLGQPMLRLTLWEDAERVIPVKQIGKLPLPKFAQLYTVSTFSNIAFVAASLSINIA